MLKTTYILLVSVIMWGCVDLPEKVEPVQKFNMTRYLGTWYEIARLDHLFERGLNNVTAEYARSENGGMTIKNRGYMVMHQEWRESEAKADFVGERNVGHLKVSYIPMTYQSYAIFDLDEDYEHAMVCGDDTGYLWLLARSPDANEYVIDEFIEKAQALGFDTSELIFVHHE